MKTAIDAIVFNLASAQGMLNAFTADLKGTDWKHRITPQGNCPAWLVGHLILTDRGALKQAGFTDLPPLPDGFEARFARTDDAPAAADFGDTTILMPLFDKHRLLLIEAVKHLPIERLEQPLTKPSPRFSTIGQLLTFMGIHVVMHAGQISMIRRSMGRPPLF